MAGNFVDQFAEKNRVIIFMNLNGSACNIDQLSDFSGQKI